MRDRIDWANLEPLPRKKRQDGASREDLAERRFNVQKATHKGRNHIHNWKRRQGTKVAAATAAKRQEGVTSKAKSFIAAVRAYWAGDTDEHP